MTDRPDISELFSRDPLKLTNENIDQIIEEMRNKRRLFESGGLKTSGAKPKATSAGTALAAKLDLKL